MSSDKNDKPSLSLGLEELLQVAKESEVVQDEIPIKESKIVTLERLHHSQKYQDLAGESESLLTQDHLTKTEYSITQLYWVLAKLKLGTIPPAVLLGTFEEAIKNLPTSAVVNEELLSSVKIEFDSRLKDPLLKTSLGALHQEERVAPVSPVGTRPSKKLTALSPGRILIILSLLLVISAITLLLTTDYFSPENKPRLVWDIFGKKSAPHSVLPEPTPMPAPSALDAVLYDLQKGSSSTGNREQTRDTASESSRSSVASEPSVAPPTVAPQVEQKKIEVSSPAEPEEISTLRKNPPERESSGESEPEQDTSRIIDGGVALPPQFKDFSQSRFYRVRRDTNVHAEPSFRSEAYAGLKKGIRLEVIGQAGFWLKVKSRAGRVGYVLAEDAAIEAEWDRR